VAGQPAIARCFADCDNFWMNREWGRVRAKMQMNEDPQFIPYVRRHTCASRLVQRGASLQVVQEWMGHKSIKVTLRYAHLAPSNLFAAAGLLEKGEG
jgi:site-specific recombinase XerD